MVKCNLITRSIPRSTKQRWKGKNIESFWTPYPLQDALPDEYLLLRLRKENATLKVQVRSLFYLVAIYKELVALLPVKSNQVLAVRKSIDRLSCYYNENRADNLIWMCLPFSFKQSKVWSGQRHCLNSLQGLCRRQNPHRIVAIDGSSLNLPNTESLKDHFGIYGNQMANKSAGAKISIAYDVCNHLVLDADITKTTGDGKEQVRKHLAKLKPDTDILIFDRGYPSLQLFSLLQKRGFKFCFRLSSSWKQAYQLLVSDNDVEWSIPKGHKSKDGSGKETALDEAITGLRLVKIPLQNGIQEVLLTNLTDLEMYPIEKIKDLYLLRWTIEECYKRIKQICSMEYFSGRTVHAIEQDFFARIIMLNLSAMIETQTLQPSLNKKTCKHPVQVNRTQLMAKLKDCYLSIFYDRQFKNAIDRMIALAIKCYDSTTT